jgi:hypothetical protein
MEPEGSLPHLQVPATCPYPEPDQSSPFPPSHFLMIYLNIILPSTSGSPKLTTMYNEQYLKVHYALKYLVSAAVYPHTN